MDHSCQELNIYNIGELSRFLQIVESSLLHQLPDNLIRHLLMKSKNKRTVCILTDCRHAAVLCQGKTPEVNKVALTALKYFIALIAATIIS